jgi:hypothetical protein
MLAMGKVGLCPYCKNKNRISPSNSQPEGMGDYVSSGTEGPGGQGAPNAMQAHIEQFARAVDLFNRAYYAEALAIFDALAAALPDNSDVLFARRQCVEAIKRPRLEAPDPSSSGPRITGTQTAEGDLDEQTVKRIVREKLLAGGTKSDEVQLKAAEIAAALLGMMRDESTPGPRADQSADASPAPDANANASASGGADSAQDRGNGSSGGHETNSSLEQERDPEMWPPEYPEGQAGDTL